MKRQPLTAIHQQAQQILGADAPSLVTIKRLSASGALNELTAPEILQLLVSRYKRSVLPPPSPTAETTTQPNRQVGESSLEQRLKSVEDLLAKYTESVDTLILAVNQINGLKNNLMLKYDAVSAQQGQTIEAQRDHIKTLTTESTLSMEVGRLRGQVQRLIESHRPG